MSISHAERAAAEVRAALARHKITQTSLAAQTGRSQAYWSRRLSGARALSMDDLATVAEITHTTVAKLAGAA